MLQFRNAARSARMSLAAGLFASLLAAPAFALDGTPVQRLVIFGDSLADSGNVFFAGQCQDHARFNNVPPAYDLDDLMAPNSAYARGGHHFTNGPTWIEDLAATLDLDVDANPAFGNDNPLATNYAFAGGRAYRTADLGVDPATCHDLAFQVSAFLEDVADSAPSDAMYALEFGGNDVFDALRLFVGLTQLGVPQADAISYAQAYLQGSANSVGSHVALLHSKGARSFLVLEAPDVGLVPAVQPDPQAAALATYFSSFYNGMLSQALDADESLDGIQILRFPLFTKIQVIAGAFAYPTTPCITPGVAPFVCANPDEHLFWDGIHPTKATHARIASEVQAYFGLVK